MKLPWRAILDALLRSKPPERPRVVEDELAKDYGDVEAWRARGGGIAPSDAPHIDGDESTIIAPQPGDTTMSSERGGRGQGSQGQGQQKTHQVRNIASGEITDVAQSDWRDKEQYPRDQYERVDDEGEETETPEPPADTGTV